MKLPSLSVFFPAYNEEANIAQIVEKAFTIIPSFAEQFEIIVINDGSNDKTAERLADLSGKYPNLHIVTHQKNRGYGAALKSGFLKAKYEYVFFTDSDGQFDMHELEEFIRVILQCDIVAGFRIERKDQLYRIINAKAYNLLVRLLFGLKISDIDCAFKLIRKKVLNSLILKSEGAFISAEFLIKSRKNGFVIKQVGVKHFPRKKGKSTGNKPSVVVNSFIELFRLRKELN